MSAIDFPGQVTDFERAPWLPCTELTRQRNRLANYVAEGIARGFDADYVRDDARQVHLMREEDFRIGEEYRTAYREWKASVPA